MRSGTEKLGQRKRGPGDVPTVRVVPTGATVPVLQRLSDFPGSVFPEHGCRAGGGAGSGAVSAVVGVQMTERCYWVVRPRDGAYSLAELAELRRLGLTQDEMLRIADMATGSSLLLVGGSFILKEGREAAGSEVTKAWEPPTRVTGVVQMGDVRLSTTEIDGEQIAWVRVRTNGVELGFEFSHRSEHCASLLARMRAAGWVFLVDSGGVWYFGKAGR